MLYVFCIQFNSTRFLHNTKWKEKYHVFFTKNRTQRSGELNREVLRLGRRKAVHAFKVFVHYLIY